MTNEQSIENLKKLKSFHNGSYGADIDRAIKALEQPCEDAISRQALLDAFGFSEKTRKWGGDHSGYDTMMLYEIQDVIESQPPVNPQKPKTDTWSIKDVADILAKHGLIVEQEPKPGRWIAEENEEMETIGYYCSECDLPMETENQTRFCPNCGAKMVEPQERSE